MRFADVGYAPAVAMAGDWTHPCKGSAIRGEAETSTARGTYGPSSRLRLQAWRLRPSSSQRSVLSALVFLILVLVTGSNTPVHAAPDPMVEAIQRALIERGFDPGKVDGAMGWRTRGALRLFQRSVGLPDSGRTDDATLQALGLRPPGDAPAQADSDPPAQVDSDPPTQADSDAPTQADPDTPPQAESSPVPSTEARKDEPPDAGTFDTEAPGAEPAPATRIDAPMAETPGTEPATDPVGDLPEIETPRAAVQAPAPSTAAPKVDTPSPRPAAAPDSDTPATETPRERTEPVPAAKDPEPESARAIPDAEPGADSSGTESPQPKPAPKRTTGPKLSFATLGWHRPQTGEDALKRFTAIGAPRDFKRGTGSLFVPNTELVFVLKSGETFPGFDCDPGAAELSVEFVFGPDGPVIFDPVSGGEYCQLGIGIALEVGRTMEMRRVDWADIQFPRGTVRITNQGLEYVR